MSSTVRNFLAGTALLSILSACTATTAANGPATPAIPGVEAVAGVTNGWRFFVNDLEHDPAVRMGTLPNGMKYALMHNETPKGGATMRMRITMGWMYESPQERGLAHMIEHLALNETKALPEGQLLKRLQLHGLKFGADTNAHTTFHETVYKLEIPTASTAILDDSLFIMREVTGNALFNKETVDRERGIILSERQMRETHDRKNLTARLRAWAPDSTVADTFMPDDNVIKTASTDTIRSLYERYYRPENATLVIVGDFNVDEMEQKVKAEFGDWRGIGTAGTEPQLGQVDASRASGYYNFSDPATNESIAISQVEPFSVTDDSSAKQRSKFLTMIGDLILARRIQKIAASPSAPLLGGGSSSNMDLFRYMNVNGFTVVSKDGQLKQSAAIAEQEYRRAKQFGFTEGEVKEALANVEMALRTAKEQAGTRRNSTLADTILGTHDERNIFTTPDFDYNWYQKEVPSINAASVSQGWQQVHKRGNPVYYVTSKAPVETATIQQWIADSAKVAVTAPAESKAAAFAYTDFGPAGQVVEDKQIADLGIRTITFANGVKLNLKKTDFEAGNIRYSMRVGSGTLAMPKDKPGLGMYINTAFTEGGLKAHSSEELSSILAGRRVGRGLAVSSDAFVSSGATIPSDLTLQMQLLAAQLTAPGYRPEADAKWQGFVPILDGRLKAEAMSVAQRNLSRIAANGDPRFGIPAAADLLKRNGTEAQAILTTQLNNGPIEIALVGAIDEEAAIKAVASTLGALPKRSAAPAEIAGSRDVKFAASSAPVKLTHTGATVDQGVAITLWPGVDDSDAKRSIEINLLTAIGTIMMQDEIREKLGATYSPGFGANMSDTYPGYGYFQAFAPAAPDKMDEIFGAYDAVIKQLQNEAISTELMDRARKPMIEQYVKAERENAAWMGIVDEAQTNKDDLDTWRQRRAILAAITPADIQRVAKQHLTGQPLRVSVVSEKANAAK